MSESNNIILSQEEIITFKIIENAYYKIEKPIANIEVQLRCLRKNKLLKGQTDRQGIVQFKLHEEHKSKYELYLILLAEQDNYRKLPIKQRNIVSYTALKEIQELRFEKYTDIFRVNKYTQNGKYYFQKGSEVTLIAHHPDFIAKEEVLWAYTFISKNKWVNRYSKLTQGDDSNLKTHKQPLQYKDNNRYYILRDKNGKQYKGSKIQYSINHFIYNAKMIIFAYTKEPIMNVYTEIILDDILQISIDCSMQEALNAKDEVSRLGWTTSYVLQRLWHDNPRDAKIIRDLHYKDADDVIDSIEEQDMKTLIRKYASFIKLKPLTIKQKGTIDIYSCYGNEINPCKFYVGLDWEEFYLKFDLMQQAATRYLKIFPAVFMIDEDSILLQNNDELRVNKDKYLNTNPHISSNLLAKIQELIQNHNKAIKEQFKKTQHNNEAIFVLGVDIKKIQNGETSNLLIYTLMPQNKCSEKPCSEYGYQNIARVYPYDIDKVAMQTGLGLSDVDFGLKLISTDDNISSQALSLYACTGKFSIYYIPAKFILKREGDKIYAYIKELYAYVFDTFDFDDDGHQYDKQNKNTIIQLGQPVGTWNYKEMRFDFNTSVRQMARYAENKGLIKKWLTYGYSIYQNSRKTAKITAPEVISFKSQDIYPLYNQDYRFYKCRYNKGLNFRVFSTSNDNTKSARISKGFYILKVPEDRDSQNYFRVEV